jgi:uncharacterized protein YjbI with pentapeptide repeats
MAATIAVSVKPNRADMTKADLKYTNLTGADLSGADLTGADLSAGVFDDVKWPKGWKLVRDE